MQDDQGNFLAGLIVGEGCFDIAVGPGHRSPHRCSFVMRMRADDVHILDEMRNATLLGSVRIHTPKGKNPIAQWRVSSMEDCQILVAILDKYSLRSSKKAREYAIWREAVQVWCGYPEPDRWPKMAELRNKLRDERVFVSLLG